MPRHPRWHRDVLRTPYQRPSAPPPCGRRCRSTAPCVSRGDVRRLAVFVMPCPSIPSASSGAAAMPNESNPRRRQQLREAQLRQLTRGYDTAERTLVQRLILDENEGHKTTPAAPPQQPDTAGAPIPATTT